MFLIIIIIIIIIIIVIIIVIISIIIISVFTYHLTKGTQVSDAFEIDQA